MFLGHDNSNGQGKMVAHSPGNDDDEVHDVPRVPQVAPLVTDEPVGQDLDRHLHREDPHEHGLELLLQ